MCGWDAKYAVGTQHDSQPCIQRHLKGRNTAQNTTTSADCRSRQSVLVHSAEINCRSRHLATKFNLSFERKSITWTHNSKKDVGNEQRWNRVTNQTDKVFVDDYLSITCLLVWECKLYVAYSAAYNLTVYINKLCSFCYIDSGRLCQTGSVGGACSQRWAHELLISNSHQFKN